jgi:hypothetical protein
LTDSVNTKQAKQVKSYTLHLEPEFNEELQKEYIDYFKEKGIPSKNKQGAVFDLCRSLPAYNKNDMGIRPEVLELSYKTIEDTLGDINHDINLTIGSTMKSELIHKGENEPIVMRICAVFAKNRLRGNPYYNIDSISNQNGFSMEALFSDWEYLVNGTILTRQEKPEITEQQVENLVLYGESIYDSQGNRVILLLGTIDNPIEFNGFALIVNQEKPADPQSTKTYLEVASQKVKDEQNKGSDKEMPFKQFETEAEFNTFIAETKNAYKIELNYDKLQGDLQTASASLQTANDSLKEKDDQIQDFTTKLATANDSLATMTTRAETAEGELQKQAVAKITEDRKQALAAKNYEVDEDDLQFIATATQEDFDKFVKRIEKVQASTTKQFETKASQMGYKEAWATINLTGKMSEDENENYQEPEVKGSVFN